MKNFFSENKKDMKDDLLLNKKEKIAPAKPEIKIIGNLELASIEVVGLDFEEIHIEYYCTEATSDTKIKEGVQINYDEEKNILEVNENGNCDKIGLIRITLPNSCSADIQSEMGSIYLKNLVGDQKYFSELGNVEVKNIQGKIEGDSENGKILIKNCLGTQNIRSENGLVDLQFNKGNFDVRTENGMIKMKKCASQKSKFTTENGRCKILSSTFEKANCQTENGSIYFEILNDIGEFMLRTENGKITAIVPKNDNIDFEANTENGTIKMGIDGDYETSSEQGTKIIKLIKGNSELKVNISTENGYIVVIDNPEAKIFKTFNQSDGWVDGIFKNFNIPNFDFEDIKDKFKDNYNKFLNEGKKEAKRDLRKAISEIEDLQNSIKNGNHHFTEDMQESLETLNLGVENIIEKMQKNLFKFDSKDIKKEVDEQSKLKILQMLEDKKITVAEAEKLLNGLR
ncbi:MAG: DUF4097 family beta strand repeat-containing protein [Candidatus Cloacimonadota bacterium]|nr:DUF4097 family beta strand repeat-containing protein [Candidatus Cloacimonadota bacterium]